MGIAAGIVAILSASTTVLCAIGSLLWWTYRRGQAWGAEQVRHEADQRAQARAEAKIRALEAVVAEMHAELAAMQSRRRH